MEAAVPRTQPTLCERCGLYYCYPRNLDYENNLCPQCGHSNNHNGHA